MSYTSSLAFPNMFNVAQNTVAVVEDGVAVSNRNRLLLLTEPAELYNSPDFGVGLSKYLFQYNNSNSYAMIQDRIREQVRKHDPYVNADNIQFQEGLLYSDANKINITQDENQLKFTVTLETTYSELAPISIDGNCKEVSL